MTKIILFFLIIPFFSLAQSGKKEKVRIDTIWTTTTERTFVYFDEDVRFIDIGSGKVDFNSGPVANCARLIAVHSDAKPTSILIDTGGKPYHGTIAFKKFLSDDERIIDFRKEAADSIPDFTNTTRNTIKKGEDVERALVIERLGIIMGGEKDKIKTLADIKGSLKFSIVDLRSDEEFLYGKLFIDNGSKADYVIKNFTYAYFDVAIGSNELAPKYVEPYKKESGQKRIEKKTKEYFTFAIPFFSLSAKGELKVSITEETGTRFLEISIPSDRINNATKF